MKTSITRKELKECVKNALEKVIKEGTRFDDDFEQGREGKRKFPKHGSMRPTKEKGGANCQRWNIDDED